MSNINEIIQLPYNFTPRPYQQVQYSLMDSGCKRYFKRWTRRSGKDLGDWNYLIKRAFERVGNYFYIFPAYTQGKKAIWEGKTKHQVRYLDYIPPKWARFNSNELKIELANGSTIRIIGSDNIHALRGAGPCGIVISEFAWQSMEVLEVLEPMLMENNGWLIINSTPNGKNFMYDFEQIIKVNPDWVVDELQSLWPDLPNYYPVISSEELDNAYFNKEINYETYLVKAQDETMAAIESLRRQGRTEESIEQEYGVSYIAGQKGAFYADCIKKARDEKRIGNFVVNNHKYVDVLFDLGRTDDTVIWFRQHDGNRVIWIDYYENNTKDLMHYVNVLKEKGYNYRTIVLPHDARQTTLQTNMSTKDLLYRLLIEARLSTDIHVCDRPSSKQIPIMLTRERFSLYYFNESTCSDGITKVSLYHREYDKKLRIFKDNPAHDWTSHAADALALDGICGDLLDSYTKPQIKYITDFNPLDYEGI
jgi:phage terminase large subunit